MHATMFMHAFDLSLSFIMPYVLLLILYGINAYAHANLANDRAMMKNDEEKTHTNTNVYLQRKIITHTLK